MVQHEKKCTFKGIADKMERKKCYDVDIVTAEQNHSPSLFISHQSLRLSFYHQNPAILLVGFDRIICGLKVTFPAKLVML